MKIASIMIRTYKLLFQKLSVKPFHHTRTQKQTCKNILVKSAIRKEKEMSVFVLIQQQRYIWPNVSNLNYPVFRFLINILKNKQIMR